MDNVIKAAAASAFKPTNAKTARQDKADATTRAAWEIMDRERSLRDAKTERLKALRLAHEADVKQATAAAPAEKATKRKTRTKA